MRIVAVALAAALLSAPGGAEGLRFEELVGRADCIAMGSVTNLDRSAGELRVQFAVERTLKGRPLATRTFAAPDLWSEPAFSDQAGRRLLVFLAESRRDTNVAEWALVPIAGDQLAYFEVSDIDGMEIVTIWSDDLEFPADFEVAEFDIAPGFITNVPLRPLLALLTRFLATSEHTGTVAPP
jgi:hypothetical protein